MPRGYWYSLVDIGFVMNQLMGSGYSSTYSQRKFRSTYYGHTVNSYNYGTLTHQNHLSASAVASPAKVNLNMANENGANSVDTPAKKKTVTVADPQQTSSVSFHEKLQKSLTGHSLKVS